MTSRLCKLPHFLIKEQNRYILKINDLTISLGQKCKDTHLWLPVHDLDIKECQPVERLSAAVIVGRLCERLSKCYMSSQKLVDVFVRKTLSPLNS